MIKKIYNIFLDGNKIGTTELENADAPMGGVFGEINFINIASGYDFFKDVCVTNGIELVSDFPEDRLILTRTINNISVKNEQGKEIKGVGNQRRVQCSADSLVLRNRQLLVAAKIPQKKSPSSAWGFFCASLCKFLREGGLGIFNTKNNQ